MAFRAAEIGIGRCPASRSRRIWCRHSHNTGGAVPARGALAERSARGSVDGSTVGFCAGPAGRTRVRRRSGAADAHRADGGGSLRADSASATGPAGTCRAESGSQGRAQGGARAGTCCPGRPAGAGTRRRSAAAHLFALDQVLPEGPGGQRQAGLLHRQGRPSRVGHAGRGRRADRAGERSQEGASRHLAPGHVAAARNARDRRPRPAHDRALRDLLQQRLHGRLRGERGVDRQAEERAGLGHPGHQRRRPAHQPRGSAPGLRQGLRWPADRSQEIRGAAEAAAGRAAEAGRGGAQEARGSATAAAASGADGASDALAARNSIWTRSRRAYGAPLLSSILGRSSIFGLVPSSNEHGDRPMAYCRTFASLMLSTALVATSVTILDVPRSLAQEAAPDARRQEPSNAQPNVQPGQPAQAGDQPQLIFSPWTKFCLKGQEANAKQVCFIGKDGRGEAGMPVVAAVLIEPQNDPKKVLRVTLPLGMSLQPGTRVFVDNGQPMTGPYVICFNNGCMADYEASGELIGKLKNGRDLVIQAINGAGQPISLVVPLQDFAKAYDGPPADPKMFANQQDDVRKPWKEWKDDRLDQKIFRRSIQ